jgi:methylmalonyl-CoA mutase
MVDSVSEEFKSKYGKAAPWAGTGQKVFSQNVGSYSTRVSRVRSCIVPNKRVRYLSEIAESVRNYHAESQQVVETIYEADALDVASKLSHDKALATQKDERLKSIPLFFKERLSEYDRVYHEYEKPVLSYTVRDRAIEQPLRVKTLSGNWIPRVARPRFVSRADHVRFALRENFPGYFPFTAGVFPLKRQEEDPKRMFAGEGPPEATNKRFHLLCAGERAKRLSTAFDSVTLYGEDPAERPDIYGKIGVSGVSIATLDDMKILYSGFDLCDPLTSVSMTINGPAPMMLAFFFNTAIDQQIEKYCKSNGKKPEQIDAATFDRIRSETVKQVRGTVQADILKEDQAQNTCIFSTEFALKMMGDIQEYFVEHDVRNYYSVSISGYHIAEAGANPITQLALTLANGFTYVEYYLSRGLPIDGFAPNLSFFFSNGLDPEYSVLGRVARRIWAIAMKRLYNSSERSQKLKYHIQTSGRSLHAQEIQFNDIRTTLQALTAYFDHCNSLHTNAYDEAITTPTEESVRRAMAIQLIITKEFGMAKNENPLQGSFIVEELTDLVEEAVLREFDRITERGGALGAMETMYQRSKIQEESLYYESMKDSGELPIIGVNTYLSENYSGTKAPIPVVRSSVEEKNRCIERCAAFRKRHENDSGKALQELKRAALDGKNIFAALMDAARVCSLGQMSYALYEVGGRYRRNM